MIFLSTQLIWYPVHFTFVFGSYDIDLTEMVFLTSLLSLAIRMITQAGVAVAQSSPLPTKVALPSDSVQATR